MVDNEVLVSLFIGCLLATTVSVLALELTLGTFSVVGYVLPYLGRGIYKEDGQLVKICLIYLVIILLNYLAFFCLLVAIASGYFEKYLSYEFFSIVSIALMAIILMRIYYTNSDPFHDIITRQVYFDRINKYDLKKGCQNKVACQNLKRFHFIHRCCGWNNYEDLAFNHTDFNASLIPHFCCSYKETGNCTYDSSFRFEQNCQAAMMFDIDAFNPTSYRYGLFYPISKAISCVLFFIGKVTNIFPRGEGIFAHEIPK